MSSISVVKHRAAMARVKERSTASPKAALELGGAYVVGALLGFAEKKGMPDGFLPDRSGQKLLPTKGIISAVAAAGALAAKRGSHLRTALKVTAIVAAGTLGHSQVTEGKFIAG